MLFYGNIGAWITIDGNGHLEEHGVDFDDREKTVTCYIASEEGKSFQVHWCDRSFECPTRGRIYIDGRAMGGKIISGRTVNRSVIKKGFRTAGNTRMPFVFSKLKLTDIEDAVSLSTESPGEIDLIIIRVRLRSRKLYDKSHTAPETLEFNEKDVKGSAHNTTFGKPVVDSRSVLEHETEPYGDPIARFRFRYMPIDLLRAKDIAPYPPRKGRLQVDEEELKPHFPIDLTTNDLAPIRSASSASTLVNSSNSRNVSVIPASSRGSSVTLAGSPAIPVKREKFDTLSTSASSAPSRAVKREKLEPPLAYASTSRAVKLEPLDSTSFRKPAGVVPTSYEVIDLTHL
ncbi:uncharacterized protein C8R40DRAFT_1120847 [Lentinula edodes]|uniref:uncharacterized protein n=1 Tax=Lentinula edodes TaxID=5353 RepID=UPI001E8E6095|nr:uncharacterized protein C8R40DRAFT_1120847 [Lentinula edodes]KAH7871549.1 hypothetical protein C8R40DRAFT_1120847 [Lentinula edodes]